MKLKLLLVLALAYGTSMAANANFDKLLELEKQEAALEADTCNVSTAEAIDTFAHGTSWVCYATDACHKKFSGCGICREHAENKALQQCMIYTTDPGTCRNSHCERE